MSKKKDGSGRNGKRKPHHPERTLSKSHNPKKKAKKILLTGRSFKKCGKIRVSGATAPSPSGVPYVRVHACGKRTWIPLGAFRRGGGAADDMLASRGIYLIGDDWKLLKAKVEKLRKFPVRHLVETPGWSVTAYALPDGTVFGAPMDGDEPVVLFQRKKDKCSSSGSLDEWLEHVAVPLVGQPLPTFVIAAMFAAPLLRWSGRTSNFGFELAGPKGVGKSTLQFLASSVLGPAMAASGRNYWISANATVAGLEGLMAEHQDLPMVIEETNLFAAGESSKTRASKFNELVFRLADGTTKGRYQDYDQPKYRFVYLTSTNEPLENILAGERIAVSDAASDRLLTLFIGQEREFGAFDFVPVGFSDSGALATSINHAVAKYYGQPIRHFLTRLVAAINEDTEALRSRIAHLIGTFREKVGVDPNSGSETRVADAFGLVYAAGVLAKDYGVLPAAMRLGTAVRAAYNLNRSGCDELSLAEQIVKVAGRKDILHVIDAKPAKVTVEQLTAAAGVLRTGKKGRTAPHVDRRAAESFLLRSGSGASRLCGQGYADSRRGTQNDQARLMSGPAIPTGILFPSPEGSRLVCRCEEGVECRPRPFLTVHGCAAPACRSLVPRQRH